MIIPPSFFRKALANKEECVLISKMVDQWVIENGHLAFGSLDVENNVKGFSSEKKTHDTHVGLIVYVGEMGCEEFLGAPPQSTTITEEDRKRAQDAQEKRLLKMQEQLEERAQELRQKERQVYHGKRYR